MGATVNEKRARAGLRASTWLPWLAALLLLGALVARTDLGALRRALGRADWLPLAAYALGQSLALLAADALATRAALAASGIRRRLAEVALARGATYLLSLISSVAGQGGVGVWAARTGAGAARATGAVAFLVASSGLALAAIAVPALLAARDAIPGMASGGMPGVAFGVLAGAAVYLAAVAVGRRWLDRLPWPPARAALAPLVETGVAGHLRAAAWRLPHLLAMVLFHWGAFRIWGIALPLGAGLALIPVVLLVAALPITPSGLGTTQAVQVLLFAPWAAGATPDERAADVLAFSLAFYAVSVAANAAVGLACLALLQAGAGGRGRAEEPAEEER